MAWNGLGTVTVSTPGTKVRATINQINPVKRIPCQSLLFQALSNASHTNNGRVYVYDANSVRIASLAIPTSSTIPSASASIPNAPGALNACDYFIDADNASDGVDISYLAP